MKLRDMQQESYEDSQRWFPQIHDRRSHTATTMHFAVGLGGEVGELLNLIKKLDTGRTILQEDIGLEMADCLVYLLDLAEHFGIDLETVYKRKRIINEERFGS